ncbi:MAG: hypothetical protein L6420_03310 [Elusimicrobia bacterium]|nr:hypothetical protein [Elusimicrobiota bacterium]
MKKIWIIFIGLMFVGCASITPHQFKGPNARTAYSMRCSGLGRTLNKCYIKAGELCPEGYNIISLTSGVVAVPANGGVLAAPRHDMAIECK